MFVFRYLVFSLVLVCNVCVARDAPSCSKILNYVHKELPHYGTLQASEDFVYVDVDDEYIHKLVTFIENDGFGEPPYFGGSDLVGAHITVAYQDEVKKYGISEVEEIGEKIYFTPKECKVVHPPNMKGVDEVYFIVVEAPELDRIRKKYGLPKRKYDFHITIGVKPKIAKSA